MERKQAQSPLACMDLMICKGSKQLANCNRVTLMALGEEKWGVREFMKACTEEAMPKWRLN